MSDAFTSAGVPPLQGFGEDPLLYFTKVFVAFLQHVFGSFEKGSYQWRPDLESTDIVISDQSVIASDVVEKRPQIVCMRGPSSWSNVAMDQFKAFDFQNGAKTHTDLVAATMVYNCISQVGLEAQRLAWISGYATRALKLSLLKAGMHRVGENVDFGPEQDASSLVPDSKHLKLVPVSVPFFFQDTYTISPVDNLLLKHLNLRLTSEAYSNQGSAIRPPSLRGQTLSTTKVFSLTNRVSVTLPDPKKK
jgi:hypothetical protein